MQHNEIISIELKFVDINVGNLFSHCYYKRIFPFIAILPSMLLTSSLIAVTFFCLIHSL
jgi:hypothetical protein